MKEFDTRPFSAVTARELSEGKDSSVNVDKGMTSFVVRI